MTVLDSCRCVGSFCNCTGVAVLKDGSRTRLGMMMDGAISGEKHVVTDAESARAAMIARDGAAWQNPGKAIGAAAVRDALVSATKEVRDHSYAEARAAGASEGEAASYAAYQAMKHDMANAWQAR